MNFLQKKILSHSSIQVSCDYLDWVKRMNDSVTSQSVSLHFIGFWTLDLESRMQTRCLSENTPSATSKDLLHFNNITAILSYILELCSVPAVCPCY